MSGLGGGICLVFDPSGRTIGLPLDRLQSSAFGNYLVPGLVPLAVARGLWKRRPWAWAAALLVGVALLGWLAVQILVVGYQPKPPLQLVYGTLGVVIVVLTLLPSVRPSRRNRP